MKTKISTIARTAVMALALINQVLVLSGKSTIPLASTEVEASITAVLTVAATLSVWWKNNSFTKEAKEADKYLEKMRRG